MHLGMGFEPAVFFGLVGVEIVQHHMKFFVGIFGNQLIHEIEELTPAAATIMSGMHQSASYVECCKECRVSVAFVFIRKDGQRATIGYTDTAWVTLHVLHGGSCFYAYHQFIL